MLGQFVLFQGVTRGILFYVVFWLVPIVCMYPMILRLKTITEHFDPGLREANSVHWIARTSCAGWLQNHLVGARMEYHFEHHVLPTIPYRGLKKLHRQLDKTDLFARNGEVISHGYVLFLTRAVVSSFGGATDTRPGGELTLRCNVYANGDARKMTVQPEAETFLPVLDIDELERNVERLHADYQSAAPYPHIVIDDFLEPQAAKAAIAEFPPLDPEKWNNYIHVNERKFSNTDPSTWGPTLQRILQELNSPRFVQFVSKLLGVDNLIEDPSLEGGGLHQSTRGGFLNIHADFTVHPHHRNWQRRANIILYLNEDWKPEYGGDLELWSTDMKECVRKVSPVANRAVIFATDATSFHGHPEPMRCPEGVARRSLALYYFSVEEDPMVRSTEYRSRPGDGRATRSSSSPTNTSCGPTTG